MKIALIRGHVISTVKHPSLGGQRLLIAQPVNADSTPAGPPQIVLDPLGAGIGQKVLLTSDGGEARVLLGDATSPAHGLVMGIIDPERTPAS